MRFWIAKYFFQSTKQDTNLYQKQGKSFIQEQLFPEATPRFRDLVRIKGIPQRDWEYKPDWSHMDFFQESLKEGAVALQQAINGVLPAYRDGNFE